MKYFVTGIDTDAGKTVVSAVLMIMLEADYWKPIQSGDLVFTDADRVKQYTGLDHTRFFREQYRLNTPASPHLSARLDNIKIDLKNFKLPNAEKLIVEGAGGLLVPITDQGETVLDLIKELNLETILVVKNYLGSINHTLLSIESLRNAGVRIKGIIISGIEDLESQKVYENIGKTKILGVVPMMEDLSPENIEKAALKLKENWI